MALQNLQQYGCQTGNKLKENSGSRILILVASSPPTPNIWWPSSNFSGQSKNNW
jgi:hypothetical protein